MKDEMDILREVSSIAAGHGSIALSEMLGRKLNLDLPSLSIIPANQVLDKLPQEQIVISVACNILTGLKGEIVFVLSEKSAFKLIDLCLKGNSEITKSGMFTEMGLSTIKEVGNIVISSYVGALSMILKTIVIPSIPTLVSGSLRQVLSMVVSSYGNDNVILLVEAIFIEPTEQIKGSFYLVLNNDTMGRIQESCKKILNSIQE
jgi:chemotaxis protein CheC